MLYHGVLAANSAYRSEVVPTPPEVVRALYIKYGFIDPDQEVSPDDERKKLPSGEAGWYEHW